MTLEEALEIVAQCYRNSNPRGFARLSTGECIGLFLDEAA